MLHNANNVKGIKFSKQQQLKVTNKYAADNYLASLHFRKKWKYLDKIWTFIFDLGVPPSIFYALQNWHMMEICICNLCV